MDEHITAHRKGFATGYTAITRAGEKPCDTGLNFGILRLMPGESYRVTTREEMAFLHMDGAVQVTVDGNVYHDTRCSVFDDSPFCVHCPVRTEIEIFAESEIEMAVCGTPNDKDFPVEVYFPEMTANEHRGKGQVDEACLRFVRTIFDDSNSHPNAELVLGEVVNFPGRWSSYPPHHHPQPEIYHYRFTQEQGFGHAELGEDVLKIRQNDTVKILDEKDHAQCSAPGYGMYYIWLIRHLPNNRYTVPEFTHSHRWTMDADAELWRPQVEVVQ